MKITKLLRKASPAEGETDFGVRPGRRWFLRRVGVGALVVGLGGQAWALLRSLVPNVL